MLETRTMAKLHSQPTLLGLAATALVIVTGIPAPYAQEATKIAGNLPLSGPVAAVTGNFPKGFAMGLDETSASEKVDARAFTTDFQDNAAKPAQAASVLQKQLASGFDAYVEGTSESASAIVDQLDETKKPQFLVLFDA